jgi:hypothetical protein
MGASMVGASERVSRGFHRLGLFLAALPLLATVLLMGGPIGAAIKDHRHHEQLVCVHNYASTHIRLIPLGDDPSTQINLHELGCSDNPQRRAISMSAWPLR